MSTHLSVNRLYYPHVDSIRGIAILMVVAFHAFSFTPCTKLQEASMRFLQALSLGVPLFFILSGFLISQIVFRQQHDFSFSSYAIRRFARIAPAFLASIFLYLLLDGTLIHKPWDSLVLTFQNILTLPNLLQSIRTINPVSWSLLVEIHFYVYFPLLFFFCRRWLPHRAEWVAILTMAIISTLCRAYAWNLPSDTAGNTFFLINRFPNAMDYFCWGLLYSIFLSRNPAFLTHRKADYCTLSGVILLLCVVIYFTVILTVTGEQTHLGRWWIHESIRLGIGVAGLLMLCTTHLSGHGVAFRLFGNKALRYIGLVSYEWFLIHLAIIPRVRFHLLGFMHAATQFPDPRHAPSTFGLLIFVISSAVGILVSFIAAALLYKWFSVPLMNVMRRRNSANAA